MTLIWRVLSGFILAIFALGCGGGASLEEVKELRQELAALKETVRQENIENLRQEIARNDSKVTCLDSSAAV